MDVHPPIEQREQHVHFGCCCLCLCPNRAQSSRKGQPEVLPRRFDRAGRLDDGRRRAAGGSWPLLLPIVRTCLLATAVRDADDKYRRQWSRIAVLPCLPLRCWWSCLVWRPPRSPLCEQAGVRATLTGASVAISCSAREKRDLTLQCIGPPSSCHACR